MAILAGIPILALAVILQSTVFSRVSLLNGSVDLVLLVVASWALNERVKDEWVWAVMAGAMLGFISAIPVWVPIFSLLLVTGVCIYLKRRIWQVPVLALLVTVVLGTVLTHLVSLGVLAITQTPLVFLEVINLVILPGLLLNLLAALPVAAVVREMAAWLYTEDPED